jgi:GTP-binding protein
MAKLSTPKLTRALQAAIEQQQPPMSGRFRPKMRYAHQGGSNPPIVVIHGSGLDDVKKPYKRYLENSFRKTFKLTGTPLRIELRSSTNPFEGKRKPLTEKQDAQRRRRKIVSKRRYG